jgi:hypothetical protein
MVSNRCLQVLVIVGRGGIMVVIEHERSGGEGEMDTPLFSSTCLVL